MALPAAARSRLGFRTSVSMSDDWSVRSMYSLTFVIHYEFIGGGIVDSIGIFISNSPNILSPFHC